MHPSSTVSPSKTNSGGAMSVSEFCRWASCGKTKLYAELKSGRLVARKLGAKTIILRDDAESWLRSLPTTAT
jgi:hypothetical protein